MTAALRVLDDGAWLSVSDSRAVGVGELWRLRGFCDCEQADFVLEGFTEVGVDGRTVEVRAYGTCIVCNEGGSTDWLPVGRLVDTDTPRPRDGDRGVFHELANSAPAAGAGSRGATDVPASGSGSSENP